MVTYNTPDNNYGVAQLIVDPVLGKGNYQTIQSAVTAATSGQTIFVRPGTYTENITLKAGVDIVSFDADAYADQGVPATAGVTILGKVTASYSGSVSISGICFKTNGDFALSLTAVTSILILKSCFIIASGNTAISFTADATMWMYDCAGNIATAATAFFTMSAGGLKIYFSVFQNTGGSASVSTCSGSAGVEFQSCEVAFYISNSGASTSLFADYTRFRNGAPDATAILTINSTGSLNRIYWCDFIHDGTGAAISIGAGASPRVTFCDFDIAGTNVITGTGTLRYNNFIYTGASSTINVTVTQSLLPTSPPTSVITATQYDVLVGGASNSIVSVGPGSAGQVLQSGGAAANPAYSTATYPATAGTSGNVLTSNGTNWVSSAPMGGGLVWSTVTVDASFTVNTGTVANKGGLLTMTLPATAAVGDTIAITGINTALGWKIAQNANQQIFFGNTQTTLGAGGSLASSATRDTVYIVCVVAGASTVYNVVHSQGNITVV